MARPRPATIAALVLLAAGFLLRAWAIDHARFTGDEAAYWSVSRRMATFEVLPVYGPEITGSQARLPGPLYYYLMAIPQRLGASPRIGSLAVVFGHALCAWLLFLIARRTRGDAAGLIALALVAFAPWEVLYADRIWGSCVVPILGTIGLYGALRSRESTAWQGVLLFICLVLPQLHMSTPILWAACAMILLLHRPQKWGWRAIAIGLAFSVAAYGHPIYAELTSGFANTRTILAKAGGAAKSADIMLTPIKVFGYAVLYGTSDISYHFGRGYWGGYDDVTRYGTTAGWKAFFASNGLWAWTTVATIVLSLVAWLACLFGVARRLFVKERSASDVLTIGLLAGLVGGTGLMMFAKKGWFPHYANILMPMLLWPVIVGLDATWKRGRAGRIAVATGLAVTSVSMLSSSVRYYRTVDGLNGLGPTMAMVGEALQEDGGVGLRFRHFHNQYAWQAIADVYYGKPLSIHDNAAAKLVVHNYRPHDGPVPDGSKVFGPVRLERRETVRSKPPGVVFMAREQWKTAKVESVARDGSVRTCRYERGRCQFGAHPWQKYAPEPLRMGGRMEPILFLHPIREEAVRVTYARPTEAVKGILRYGLSDEAAVSNNLAPVEVTVRVGATILATAKASNRKGLFALPFTLPAARTSTATDVTVQIETRNDGARVFGFDLELYR